MLWPAGSPARPRIMPSVKNPRMTRLPPMPLQTEILRPVPISKPETACRSPSETACGSPPAPVSRAPCPSSEAASPTFPPMYFQSSQARMQLPATPPMLSAADARPIEGSAPITSLSLPVSQPRNSRSSQVTAIMGFWSPFIRRKRPKTIPAAMQAITLNILCLYYPWQ